MFIKVKHGKGKDLCRPQVWVFGLYDRMNNKALFLVVKSRDASSLLNLIYEYVEPNSIIYSDCWRSYSRINKLDKNYTHLTVNHNLHFVDPQTGVHTNAIESLWCSAKVHIKKMRGVNRAFLQSYLDEYVWRRQQSNSKFSVFNAILE